MIFKIFQGKLLKSCGMPIGIRITKAQRNPNAVFRKLASPVTRQDKLVLTYLMLCHENVSSILPAIAERVRGRRPFIYKGMRLLSPHFSEVPPQQK